MAEHERVELAKVLERREVALREWRSLSSRSKRDEDAALERVKELNKLADDVAEEEARGREEEQRQRVAEVEASLTRAEASVREIGEGLLEERNRLRVLERETSRARQHDPASKAHVETLEVQEREQIQWFAQHRPHRPDEWPVELRDQIAARVEQMRAENEASRARLKRDSEASLAAVGITVGVDAYEVREGHAFPRIR